MAVPNALAFYDTVTIMAVKSFIVQAPGQFFDEKGATANYEFVCGEIRVTRLGDFLPIGQLFESTL